KRKPGHLAGFADCKSADFLTGRRIYQHNPSIIAWNRINLSIRRENGTRWAQGTSSRWSGLLRGGGATPAAQLLKNGIEFGFQFLHAGFKTLGTTTGVGGLWVLGRSVAR